MWKLGCTGRQVMKMFSNSQHFQLVENELNPPEEKPLPNDENGKAMPFVMVVDEALLSQNLYCAHIQAEVCTFGILTNKWRILYRPLDTNLEFSDFIVKACCMVHNFVRKCENLNFEDTLNECPLENTPPVEVFCTRDYFADYFISPQGCVSWQYNKI